VLPVLLGELLCQSSPRQRESALRMVHVQAMEDHLPLGRARLRKACKVFLENGFQSTCELTARSPRPVAHCGDTPMATSQYPRRSARIRAPSLAGVEPRVSRSFGSDAVASVPPPCFVDAGGRHLVCCMSLVSFAALGQMRHPAPLTSFLVKDFLPWSGNGSGTASAGPGLRFLFIRNRRCF